MLFPDREVSGSFIISFSPDQDQPQECEDAINDQQLKSEGLSIEQPAGVMTQCQAEQRGKEVASDTYQAHHNCLLDKNYPEYLEINVFYFGKYFPRTLMLKINSLGIKKFGLRFISKSSMIT